MARPRPTLPVKQRLTALVHETFEDATLDLLGNTLPVVGDREENRRRFDRPEIVMWSPPCLIALEMRLRKIWRNRI